MAGSGHYYVPCVVYAREPILIVAAISILLVVDYDARV
jgi:hypothetical protein